jgi:ATP-dependent exoDNAse (exonuclease V) beta subunit
VGVICLRYDEVDTCAHALSHARLPHQVRRGSGSFHPNENTIKVLTMHASKGLEFPVVALAEIPEVRVE